MSILRKWWDKYGWVVTMFSIWAVTGFAVYVLHVATAPAPAREDARQIIELVMNVRFQEQDEILLKQEQRLMQLEAQKWTEQYCKSVETAQLQSLWAEINYLHFRANMVDKHMSGCGCWPREEP